MSSYKRSSKLKLFLLIAVVSASSIYLFLYFLPQLTEILIPLYLKTQGIKDFQIKVDKITPHEISVHSVKLGKGEEITLSKAKISYSFKEILEGKVNSIDITGLSLDLQLKNGRLFPGFLQSLPQAQEGTEKKRNLPLILPFNKIVIRNSKITLSTPEDKIVVFLNAGIDNLGKDNIMKSNVNISLKSNRGNATAKISLAGSPEKFEGNFELAAEGEINIPKTARISHGNISLKGNVSFQNHLLSLRMNEAKVRTDNAIEISDFNTKIEPFQLSLKRDTESKFLIDFSKNSAFAYDLQLEPTPFKINVKDKNMKIIPLTINLREARFNGSRNSLNYKVEAVIKEVSNANRNNTIEADLLSPNYKITIFSNGTINNLGDNPGKNNFIKSNINVNFRNKQIDLAAKAFIKGTPLSLKGNIDLSVEGGFDLPDVVNIPHGFINLKSDISYLNKKLSMYLKEAELILDKPVESGKAKIFFAPFQIKTKNTKNHLLIDFSKNNTVVVYNMRFTPLKVDVRIKNNSGGASPLNFNLREMGSYGKLNLREDKPLDYKIIVEIKESDVSIPEFDIAAEGMNIKTEIYSQKAYNEINVSLNDIFIKHLKAVPYIIPLSLQGQINYSNGLSEFKGSINDFNEKFFLDFSGDYETKSNDGKLNFELLPLSFSKDTLKPEDIFPVIGESISDVEGKIELGGKLSWSGGKLKPDIFVQIKDFSFNVAEKKVVGINGSIEFDGLFPLSTPPNQVFSIAKLEAGLPFENGDVNFHIRSEKLFVKKIKWDWAGGALYTDPFQINLNNPKANILTLNISDIQLNDLLSMISQEDISGTGTLNGSIPIEFFDDGSFLISDGILKATPEGGIIRYRPKASMPLFSKDNENIKILIEALDDFHYNKLELTLKKGTEKGIEGFLAISGSNPKLYNGKAIELNIKLTGDLNQVLQSALGIYKIPGKIQKYLLN